MARRGPKPKKPAPEWSQVLTARRDHLKLRQEDVAERTNGVLEQSSVSELERGESQLANLTYHRLSAYAAALGWSVWDLQERTGVYVGAEPTGGQAGGLVHVPFYGPVETARTSGPPQGQCAFTLDAVGNVPATDLYAVETGVGTLMEAEMRYEFPRRSLLLFQRTLAASVEDRVQNLWLERERVGVLCIWRPQRRPVVLEAEDPQRRPIVVDDNTPYIYQGAMIGYRSLR